MNWLALCLLQSHREQMTYTPERLAQSCPPRQTARRYRHTHMKSERCLLKTLSTHPKQVLRCQSDLDSHIGSRRRIRTSRSNTIHEEPGHPSPALPYRKQAVWQTPREDPPLRVGHRAHPAARPVRPICTRRTAPASWPRHGRVQPIGFVRLPWRARQQRVAAVRLSFPAWYQMIRTGADPTSRPARCACRPPLATQWGTSLAGLSTRARPYVCPKPSALYQGTTLVVP